jgi:hypothetical protein
LKSPWAAAQVVQRISILLNGIETVSELEDGHVTTGMSTKPGTMLATGL